MGRIPLVEYDDAPPDLRELYDRITAARGSVLNVYKGMANHPYCAETGSGAGRR